MVSPHHQYAKISVVFSTPFIDTGTVFLLYAGHAAKPPCQDLAAWNEDNNDALIRSLAGQLSRVPTPVFGC